jgi:pyruvate-formate lyase
VLWNNFDNDRQHLEAQYRNTLWDEESGLSLAELEDTIPKLVEELNEQSKIIIKAKVFAFLLEHGRISIDPRDWYADHLLHGDILIKLRNSWTNNTINSYLSDVHSKANIFRSVGACTTGPNFSHVAPDWERILALGPNGILNHIKQTRQYRTTFGTLSREDLDFYDAAEIVWLAFIKFVHRLADGCIKIAVQNDTERGRMNLLAQCLRNIATRPPESLHEALQLAYLCHELMEMEGVLVRSMGHFDRLYYRFYEADLQLGRFTRDQTKELIKYFFIKFFAKTNGLLWGKNFVLGGIGRDGKDVTNPLSYLTIEAYEEMDTVDPKLSIRVHKGTPEHFLKRVASCIRKGCNGIVVVNDEIAIPALIQRGTTEEEARNYVLMGCYEPAILGKEVPCSGSQWINLAKAVEWALHNGADPLMRKQIGPATGNCNSFETFSDFKAAFFTQLRHLIEEVTDLQLMYERYWKEMNRAPLLSSTMVECVDKARDISEGGAKYNNTGCCIASLASTVDSLVAINDFVFTKKIISMRELTDALNSDWDGHELLRLKIQANPNKYGNNRILPDELAQEITQFVARIVNSKQNERGGKFCAGLNSIDHCVGFGRDTSALPDGRKARQPLSKNLDAVIGMDRNGVTALINSVAKIDFSQYPNGSVLDIMLHPSAVQGQDGLTALVGLVRSYFALGGFGIQFNIFNADTLRAAQQHPEKYTNLQVRVCGWSVRFVNLRKIEQDMFIEQAEKITL